MNNNKIEQIKNEIKKVVVGHEELINSLLIGLISDGHILVEGVPGLAKTTAINAISKALGIEFKRIQFTPDLLPSDITGTEIYSPKTGDFSIKMGPIFTNLLLADEINRAPAKVQSALLEVMQEKQTTIGNQTFKIPTPFLVMATQNPIESEGAYRLPEAQLDRFMLKVNVGYNTLEEEMDIVSRVAINGFETINQVADVSDILEIRKEFKTIFVDEPLRKYMAQIIFASREPKKYHLDQISEYIEFGASPRASIDLYKASCAFAYIRGNDYVTPLDINSVVSSVLRHRIILNYKAQANGIDTDYIIKQIMLTLPRP
jgi:MoxR-like ATPase